MLLLVLTRAQIVSEQRGLQWRAVLVNLNVTAIVAADLEMLAQAYAKEIATTTGVSLEDVIDMKGRKGRISVDPMPGRALAVPAHAHEVGTTSTVSTTVTTTSTVTTTTTTSTSTSTRTLTTTTTRTSSTTTTLYPPVTTLPGITTRIVMSIPSRPRLRSAAMAGAEATPVTSLATSDLSATEGAKLTCEIQVFVEQYAKVAAVMRDDALASPLVDLTNAVLGAGSLAIVGPLGFVGLTVSERLEKASEAADGSVEIAGNFPPWAGYLVAVVLLLGIALLLCSWKNMCAGKHDDDSAQAIPSTADGAPPAGGLATRAVFGGLDLTPRVEEHQESAEWQATPSTENAAPPAVRRANCAEQGGCEEHRASADRQANPSTAGAGGRVTYAERGEMGRTPQVEQHQASADGQEEERLDDHVSMPMGADGLAVFEGELRVRV